MTIGTSPAENRFSRGFGEAKIVDMVALPEPAELDATEKLDGFLDAVRWGAASTADVKNIQSPFRSGVELEDYQLDTVVRAIQMPRVVDRIWNRCLP
jgi:hypothetical protein